MNLEGNITSVDMTFDIAYREIVNKNNWMVPKSVLRKGLDEAKDKFDTGTFFITKDYFRAHNMKDELTINLSEVIGQLKSVDLDSLKAVVTLQPEYIGSYNPDKDAIYFCYVADIPDRKSTEDPFIFDEVKVTYAVLKTKEDSAYNI
ncbi:hypothetical protein CEW46_21480 [Bacillus cereus]|nr:hypothetical protein CEW46_21480 [Bacillus cereus]